MKKGDSPDYRSGQPELSAEDIAAALRISRASISTNMRLLLNSSVIEKVSYARNRNTYFVFSAAAWEGRTLAAIQSALAFRTLAEQGLAALPPGDSSRHHLEEAIRWSDLLVDTLHMTLAGWQAQRQAPPKGRLHGAAIR